MKKKPRLVDAVLLLIGTLLMFSPPSDPDFGWHYKYGEYFFKFGHLLTENIFSYTYTDYVWVNSYWLFELILFITHSILGSFIPTLILSFTASFICLKLVRKVAQNEIAVYLSYVFLMGMLGSYGVTIRPHFYSSLFTLFMLYALIFEPKLKKYLPFVYLFWVNLHAEFVIGLFMLGSHTLFTAVQKLRKGEKLTEIAKDFIVPAACAVVTLINPNGLGLHITLFKELTLPVKNYVQEWSHFDTSSVEKYVTYVFLLSVSLVGGFVLRKKAGLWYFLLAIFFAVFSIKASYMIRVMFIFSFYGFLYGLDHFFTKLMNFLDEHNQLIIKRFVKYSYVASLIVVLVNGSWKIIQASDIKYWSKESKYPYDAVVYLKQNPIRGRMLNAYNWGGYLIWQYPERQTFIDGRMTSWREDGKYFMEDYYKISQPETLNFYVEKYLITWVFDHPKSKLSRYLTQRNDLWEEYYRDDISVIFIKKSSKPKPYELLENVN
ncbi:hypothetical protein A2415_02785 [candidate division WWE3 bacterium RIFOXYC1_FULL_39_7]|uniref:Glycosyltransferase RgtA/B/C/D-like domain-containing protein n=2 Tax=Katanobacteria TaxID=422282 RepID=A0A1F4X688_UNCKA|nr:MAG: hypothetical protein A2415_02785 [candidate division WWE3 bacterium RIFOXYC1_FULL_39_7]OGC76623.1 MAG: hypothetical protein A2619_04180 [candidate division WWE3 bacterium RIFOXYD1_FULL_39_9]